jgi:cobalt-precorrin-7 (C5)-methyltransferase
VSDSYDLDSGPDPAALAASGPEPESTPPHEEIAVQAVGIGPGNPEYLTARTRRAISEADVVVGFETVVEFVRGAFDGEALDARLFACGYADESEALEGFGERVRDGARGTAVLMGDPNFSGYQFVGKVQATIDGPVRVLPGISSLQVAASRARTPMEDSTFITLHKSGDITDDLDRLCETVGDRHLLVLPRPYDWMPGDIAAELLAAGAPPSLEALVFERLTHDDERVTHTNLAGLADHAGGTGREETAFSDLSVLAIRAGEIDPLS